MILKDLFSAIGVKLEIRNIITDFRLKNGRSANQAHQLIANGVECTDAEIISRIKSALPDGSRICGIFEVYGDMEVDELQRLAGSLDLFNYKTRVIYLDEELAAEYIQEIRQGDFS